MEGMRRPKVEVLPDSALVPDANRIVPPPNRFTHEVIADQPYYYASPRAGSDPPGTFAAGTKVVLLVHDGGPACRVVDGRGLYVATAFGGLRPLT